MAATRNREEIREAPSPNKFYCKSRLPQYYTGFVVSLAVMNLGTVFSWSATAMPDINSSKNTDLGPFTPTETSWLTSIVMLGSILVCPVSGFFMKTLGLRGSMLTLTFPLVIGWILIIFAKNFWMLLIGRFVTGFCAGGIPMAAPVLIAEIAEPEIRGKLGYGYSLFYYVGQLFSFVIGSLLPWKLQSVACGIIPLLVHCLIMIVPESPRTLISKNKMNEAKKSIAWSRHAPSLNLIAEEFNYILDDFKQSAGERDVKLRDYFEFPLLVPILLGAVLMLFNQWSGAPVLFTYTVRIFRDAGVNNSYIATVLVGLTQVIVACFSALAIDRIGRRLLLVFSGIWMSISLICLGGYLHCESLFEGKLNWVPVALVILFVTAFSLGFGPIPWVVVGEILPHNAVYSSSMVIHMCNRLFSFVVVLLFNDIVSFIGQDGMYWLFGGICTVGTLFVYFFLFETKGKSLSEIQLYFDQFRRV